MLDAPPDLELEKARCREFVANFRGDDDELKYKSQLLHVANRECKIIQIWLDDVSTFFEEEDSGFIQRIEMNTKRYIKLFCEVADELMPMPTREDLPWDLWDEYMSQAQERNLERKKAAMRVALANPSPKMNINPNLLNEAQGQTELPASLKRRFEIQLKPRVDMTTLRLRQVDAKCVGRLIKIAGVVAQVSDVKPLIRVATYVDIETGEDYYQEVLGRSFIPLQQAPSVPGHPATSGRLEFLRDHSKYISYQEVKIQENQAEVPEGTTPRSLRFALYGGLVRSVKPGDHVIVAGICIAQPSSGHNSSRPGLLASAFVETMDLRVEKMSYTAAGISDADLAMIQSVQSQGNVYSRLAKSIAPEIHGHVDIKKVLLLMMVGGNNTTTEDGMKLRGDIHICLMGDPGVAKSQLLKFVTRVAPRSVYTTGKGSSGVGLTASVVRDENKEPCLEGGALVLADRGICCIDEFDKMEETDRTAIHEVMEQQTVSIAKAGITTTLNARTTILAAANPAWGRYNPKKTPSENIALPHALLSRFDIMWLILDKADGERDKELSQHILHVHRFGSPPQPEEGTHLSPDQLRSYITAAKAFEPEIPKELADYVARTYARMRQENLDHKKAHTYTTPRTLMSIVRLSQAIAKLQFRDRVVQDDVEEALRLMRQSKISLSEDDRRGGAVDVISAIYQKMNRYWKSSRQVRERGITFGKIRELCSGLDLGSRNEKIKECIEEYSSLGIINVAHGEEGEPIVHFVSQ